MRALLTYIFCVLIVTIPSKILAFDGKTAKNFLGLYEVKQGVLAHDRGWFGKNREGFGPDYNFELMFNDSKFASKLLGRVRASRIPPLFRIILSS